MRNIYAESLKNVRSDFTIFSEDVQATRKEFQTLLELPVDSVEYKAKISKFEKFLEKSFDANMVIGLKFI